MAMSRGEVRVRKHKVYVLEPSGTLIQPLSLSYDRRIMAGASQVVSSGFKVAAKASVKAGKEVGFITLGDPMIYSTYVYIMERLMDEIEVETIPGISSFSNIASNQNFPLVMDTDPLMVIPCTMEEEKIDAALQTYDCFVLMKVYKNFKEIVQKLEKYDLIDSAILVSNSSQDREVVYKDLRDVHLQEKISYFSTILVNKNNKRK